MSRVDGAEWAEAYSEEYVGLKQRDVFEVVRIEKGTKLVGITTRTSTRWSTASSQSANADCALREFSNSKGCKTTRETGMHHGPAGAAHPRNLKRKPRGERREERGEERGRERKERRGGGGVRCEQACVRAQAMQGAGERPSSPRGLAGGLAQGRVAMT